MVAFGGKLNCIIIINYDANHNAHACIDMGVAESDGSYLAETCAYSLNTTSRIKAQLRSLDIVLHIGDISYALGYSSMVRKHCVYNILCTFNCCQHHVWAYG